MLPQAKVIHFLLERSSSKVNFSSWNRNSASIGREPIPRRSIRKSLWRYVLSHKFRRELRMRSIQSSRVTIFSSRILPLPEPFLFYFLPGFRQILPVSAAPLLFFFAAVLFFKGFREDRPHHRAQKHAYGHYQRGHGADEASSRTQNIV